jgi:hypothetical protein
VTPAAPAPLSASLPAAPHWLHRGGRAAGHATRAHGWYTACHLLRLLLPLLLCSRAATTAGPLHELLAACWQHLGGVRCCHAAPCLPLVQVQGGHAACWVLPHLL